MKAWHAHWLTVSNYFNILSLKQQQQQNTIKKLPPG